MFGRAVHPVGSLLEGFFSTQINIGEGLGIPVKQWEPAALDMYHDLMSFLEGVVHIGEGEFHMGHF